MPNFSTPSKVQQVIRQSDPVEFIRDANRSKVLRMANGEPPLSPELAKELNIKVNVNWLEMTNLLANAKRQYLTAFLQGPHFFKVTLPLAPSECQSEWGAFITETINRPMRDSQEYFEYQRATWSDVVMHGASPRTWRHPDFWRPSLIAIEDLRVATDTEISFRNLDWWAERRIWTVFELLEEVFNDKPNNHWNKKEIAKILKNYKEMNFAFPQDNYNWETAPSKGIETIRQDGGFWASTAIPAIPLWHFYFRDETKEESKGIFMRVVPETGAVRSGQAGPDPEEFLWTSDKPIARDRCNVLQCQFGDLNNKAPYLYPAVRSLGSLLLEPCFYTNLLRSRQIQHVSSNMDTWLRVTDPIDKGRPQIQEFSNLGVLRTGMSIVPQTERHQIDAQLLETTLAQLKQLQQEASSVYTQALDSGTKKEQTAFEVSVRNAQVNAMLSGLLMTAFKYASYEYKEICRRFCLRTSNDPDIQKFHRLCKQVGIPKRWINIDYWDIEPVTPLGMGNPTSAMASAQQLVGMIPMLDATAQQEIKHEAILVYTGDPRKAARWAPLGTGRGMTDATRDAMSIFGTLMQGVPVPPREGLSATEQVETILALFAGVITKIEQRDQVAEKWEISGMMTVAQYAGGLIQKIGQDPSQKQQAKLYSTGLGKLMNQVKALAQAAQEQQQSKNGNGVDPATMAKVQATMLTTQAKIQDRQQQNAQKQRHKEESFVRQQRRDDASTWAQIQRDNTKHRFAAFSGGEE